MVLISHPKTPRLNFEILTLLQVRVSSVILASEDCETAGGIQAIQITQADEVCDENVTSVTWPPYSDWELDTSRNTIYPEAFGKKKKCRGRVV